MNVFKGIRRVFCSRTSSEVADRSQAPIFVFAACWRTGSTLLQRVLNASGQVLVWGEPACLNEVDKLHRKAVDYLSRAQTVRSVSDLGRQGQWIPKIAPSVEKGRDAVRAFFDTLYGQPAREFGFTRWGFKEVRPGAASHIELLAELFPEARFLFLIRHPLDTFRSLQGKKFFANFSHPMKPMEVWRDNVEACVLTESAISEKILTVRYEELTNPDLSRKVLGQICTHARLDFREAMVEEVNIVVDSSRKKNLSSEDCTAVSEVLMATANRAGYDF